MRPLLFLLSCCWLLAPVQPVAAQDLPQRYWIYFTEDTPRTASEAPSEAAQQRRARRGLPQVTDPDADLAPGVIAALRTAGVEPLLQSRWLNAVSAELRAEDLTAVEALPFVHAVRPVARLQATLTVAAPMQEATAANDSLYGPSQRQLEQINVVPVLERGLDGTGVRIGFLDAEFDFTHPAFDRLVSENRVLADSNFTGLEQGGGAALHGRSVASVAVGYLPGLLVGPAHGASIVAATTEYVPTETNAEEDAFVAAIEWMERDMGVDVINISLGYTTFDDGQRSYTTADLDGNTGATTIAADRAASLGVVVVASAGNSACSTPENCWYFISTPADGDDVIAVGAMTPNGSRASFSSFGPTADGRIKPDVSASGTSVVLASAPDTVRTSQGTSFAAPLVAGVAALMLQANPNLTPTEVRSILRSTASQAETPDNALGWGLIDAQAAVLAAEALATGTDPIGTAPTDAIVANIAPHPAPAQAHLTLQAPGPATDATLSVYDLLGRRVWSKQMTLAGGSMLRLPLDLSALASGLYLYEVTAGEHTLRGTFIRQ